MQLRPSRILEKLRAGQTVGSVKLNLADPRAVEIAGMCGVDCVWICMEHVPNTLHDVANMVRAAKIYDVDTIVRVPRGSYSDLIYPLEMDAAGIMIPHVRSAAEAKQLVEQVRFHPLGRRALDGGNADGGYCGVPLAEYMQHANEQRLVIVQIEDPQAMDELDAIAAVDGIDMLLFGPGDYTQGLGVPGQFDDPRVDEARKAVAAAALRHGKFAGTTASADVVDRYKDMGYRFMNVGADVIALRQQFTATAELFGNAPSPVAASPYSDK